MQSFAAHLPKAQTDTLSDRRRVARAATFVRARLEMGDASVDCAMVERSPFGACVVLDVDQALPAGDLTLVTYHDNQSRGARVRWRRGRRIGVLLLGPA
ncbi:PilZ domain-containing protein [uncultured Caulobacter sp.]|uniref:PilZ domain-containing protein n=1 Tax=uncultured Caulobacter sp. TaxID=158749 RepID=UPI00262E76F0|nr:PilZ domain-containing protein [uncultured Caulobacter sp.]